MLKYKFKQCICLPTHHNPQFSSQIVMQGSRSICVCKTHHNLQFSPQMQKHKFTQCICPQNPPQSSLFATNSKAIVQTATLISKPTTINCFHHKKLKHKFKECLCLQNPPQSYVFTTNSNGRVKKYLCLPNSPHSSVFTSNAKAGVQIVYMS